jgi:hypothetical protein
MREQTPIDRVKRTGALDHLPAVLQYTSEGEVQLGNIELVNCHHGQAEFDFKMKFEVGQVLAVILDGGDAMRDGIISSIAGDHLHGKKVQARATVMLAEGTSDDAVFHHGVRFDGLYRIVKRAHKKALN